MCLIFVFLMCKQLYIPFWLNLYKKTWRILKHTFFLYIPFWLNLYVITGEYFRLMVPLHSILVKSIHNRIRKETVTDTTLHSILVKSIPIPEYYQNFLDYTLHSILVKSIQITGNEASNRLHRTLHSILVKSIRILELTENHDTNLYIPFWLNLYPSAVVISEETPTFTFHSG